jgi:hypothetical protein
MRLKVSTMVSTRSFGRVASWSPMKFIAQVSFGRVAA